jgi:hypothetical protein
MINYDLKIVNDVYSGGLQDIYAMIIFGKHHQGTFIDIGCRHPVFHNNTYLLEQYGWRGFAVDLEYFTPEWENERPNSKYLNRDAFTVNYQKEFKSLGLESPIDFLSIDLELAGERLNILKKVFETEYEFKTITIEHDAYCGYDETEKIPQRKFLQEKGYILVRQCEWIEDFWINPKYISEDKYEILKQVNSRDGVEVHAWTHLKSKGYDWTHFYKEL